MLEHGGVAYDQYVPAQYCVTTPKLPALPNCNPQHLVMSPTSMMRPFGYPPPMARSNVRQPEGVVSLQREVQQGCQALEHEWLLRLQ